MTVTPSNVLKASRRGHFTWNSQALGQNTTVKAIGQGDTGMPIRFPCRFTSMWCSGGQASGGSAGQTVTFTAYKNSVAAGNKVFEVILTETGAADTLSGEATTPANSEAVNTFAAGDDLILIIVTSAATGTFAGTWCVLEYETFI